MAILTRTPLIRANAYRHYSTASFYGLFGYTVHAPAESPVWDGLIRAGGGTAELLFTGQSAKRIAEGCCSDFDGPHIHDDVTDLCADLLRGYKPGFLRVAKTIFDTRGRVSGQLLTAAFEGN